MPKKLEDEFDTRGRPRALVREQTRWSHLKRVYGLSKEDYTALLENQGLVCAICKSPHWGGQYNSPNVDHDHSCCPGTKSCGKCVRGLLCMNCNSGIGRFGDDVAALAAAIEYLVGWAANPSDYELPIARALRTHCKNGHEYTEENTFTQPNGARGCRACNALRMRLCRERKRVADG